MTKGTPSKGTKRRIRLHVKCRRCGKASYHVKKHKCSSCGYGHTSKVRKYAWQKKYKLKRHSHLRKGLDRKDK